MRPEILSRVLLRPKRAGEVEFVNSPFPDDLSLKTNSLSVMIVLSALLSVVIYAPFLSIASLPDDYLQVMLARKYGPISAWPELAADALYRSRATSLIVTFWTESIFGFSRLAFGLTSICLQAINALLVYSLGKARCISWQVSGLTAIFFLLQERPAEAVIWYAALPELLVFSFSLLTIALWIRWLQLPKFSIPLLIGALLSFCLAMLSKESAVAVIPLMMLFIFSESHSRKRAWIALLPFVLLGAGNMLLVFSGQQQNHHFEDGTFSLQAGAFTALIGSTLRSLWFWGIVSLIVTLSAALRRHSRLMLMAVAWILIALLPYSFLTYMPRVPSRHQYLAAVGVSLLLALATFTLRDRTGRSWVTGVCILVIGLHHSSYLWTVKYKQFQERTAPVESLLQFMQREKRRPVIVHCFPYAFEEARRAVVLRLGEAPDNLRQVTEADSALHPVFCPAGHLSQTNDEGQVSRLHYFCLTR
jgi:hypothetical protein